MNPTNKPLAITLGGKRYFLYYDLNTFAAFEKESGKFFLDFLATMEEAISEMPTDDNADAKKASTSNALRLLRKVSIRDIQFFLWAAIHEYDKQGEPVWPMTVGQVSRLIDINNVSTLLPEMMRGNYDNMPEVEAGKAPEDAKRPTKAAESIPENGGATSGPSDEVVLASLTKNSDG